LIASEISRELSRWSGALAREFKSVAACWLELLLIVAGVKSSEYEVEVLVSGKVEIDEKEKLNRE
jgi:hypothetical protein